MNAILEKLMNMSKNCEVKLTKVTTIIANNAFSLISEDVDGSYMLDTLLVQQKDYGFDLVEVSFDANKETGSAQAILEGTLVHYKWDKALGLWD